MLHVTQWNIIVYKMRIMVNEGRQLVAHSAWYKMTFYMRIITIVTIATLQP